MFSGEVVIPDVDKCGADISNLHWDGRPCTEEDNFWIVASFLWKIYVKQSIYLDQR
jgi:hypothetical protein